MSKGIVESDMIVNHPNSIDNMDNGGLNNDFGLKNLTHVTNIQNARDVRHNINL